jgi:S1-C subfamily serine protease
MTGGWILDVLLVVLLSSYAVSGYRQGLVVSALSLVGFLGGGAIGMAVLPGWFTEWTWASENPFGSRALLIGGVFLLAAVGQALAVQVARRMRRHLHARPAVTLDAVFGGVASVVAVGVLVWFVAGGLRGTSSTVVGRAIGESRVLAIVDAVVPPQTGALFAGFRQVLDQGGFPRVFDGLATEPIIAVDPPRAGALTGPGVAAATESMVKITGVAAQCHRGQEGSGWVVSPGRVVTNAHVVAGIEDVTVRLKGTGPALLGTVVVFDPQRDLAVVAVPDLSAPALSLGPDLGRGADAVVAGFPLDGPLRLDAARVRQTLTATGQDIYGRPGATREIYSLFARVEPGNSGGPLLTTSGEVAGVVFATSLDDEQTGYALTLAEAAPVLQAAATARSRVPTGACSLG